VRRRALDGDRQRVDLDRLADEVVGARADRGDRRIEASERRDDDDRDRRSVLSDALAQVDAAHLVHVQVGDDDVEIALFQQAQRIGRGRVARGAEATLAQADRERLAERAVVVDEKHLGRHACPPSRAGDDSTHCASGAGRCTAKTEPFPGSLATS